MVGCVKTALYSKPPGIFVATLKREVWGFSLKTPPKITDDKSLVQDMSVEKILESKTRLADIRLP